MAGDVDDVRALIARSMGHWPHDDAYLAQAVELMSIDADDLERDEAWILEDGAGAIGFYRISIAGDSAEIEELHLEPDRIGHGFGRTLFEHAISRAKERGVTRLEWSCDEYALGFYLAMGGQITGSIAVGNHGRRAAQGDGPPDRLKESPWMPRRWGLQPRTAKRLEASGAQAAVR